MKFEKLNENKIRITFNTQDLMEKHIDFHSFMSNSKESQNLFLDMLDEAEKKVGFVTKDYKLRIEALALSNGSFIITITRFGKNMEAVQQQPKKAKNLKINRKKIDISSKQLIYKFSTFDDFCNFSNFVSKMPELLQVAKSIILYSFNDAYYLYISKINTNNEKLAKLYAIISEFGTYVDNSEIFARVILERGKVAVKNNAIATCAKFFSTQKA